MGEPPTLAHAFATRRLQLRPCGDEDVEALLDLFRRPGVRRYLLDGRLVDRRWVVEVVEDSRATFAGHRVGLWVASIPDAAGVLGIVGFKHFHDPPVLELLYALDPAHWGRGFATEMARGAIEYGFGRAGLDLVRATIDAPNAASAAVLRRLGMRRERSEPATPPTTLWEQVHYVLER